MEKYKLILIMYIYASEKMGLNKSSMEKLYNTKVYLIWDFNGVGTKCPL